MNYVGLDGFREPIGRFLKPNDTFVRISNRGAGFLGMAVPVGSFTYLVLNDGVSYEIVRYVGGADAVASGMHHSDVPVERGFASPVKFNFPCGTMLSYQITTLGMKELIAQALQQAAITPPPAISHDDSLDGSGRTNDPLGVDTSWLASELGTSGLIKSANAGAVASTPTDSVATIIVGGADQTMGEPAAYLKLGGYLVPGYTPTIPQEISGNGKTDD